MIAASWFQWANWVEAALWIVMGIGFLAGALARSPLDRRRRCSLGLVLIAFGLSDIIEAETGAWYRPLGLLIWKGICVICLLTSAMLHLKGRKARPTDR